MLENYKELQLEEKKLLIEDLHAYDLKELYLSLDEVEQDALFDILTDEKKADLLSYLDIDDAVELVSELEVSEQADIFQEMEPDDAIDIINELDDDEKALLIPELEADFKAEYISLSQYSEQETGSIMTTSFLKITPDMEIKSVMKLLIKDAPELEIISKLYVVDKHDTFIGIVPLKKLIKAKSPLFIQDLYEPSQFVFDKDDIEDSVDFIQESGINLCPVLNEQNELVGVITLDDAIDTYEDEMIEDFQKMTLLGDESDEKPFASALKRLPWLVLLLFLALPIARLALTFEHVLQSYTIIVILQPLILSMVGNAGTQTLTFSLIMLSDDEPNHVIKKNILYELLSAVSSGFILGSISFLVTILFILINPSLDQSPLLFGLIIALSVWCSITTGTFFSSIIPVSIKKVGLDPAAASGPLITTMIDISTIIIYYGLASILIGVFL
jgi:magnesium transporter